MKMTSFAKLLLVVFLGGIGFSFYAAWKEMRRAEQIEAEVEKLRMEAERVKGENQELSERIAYFGTESYEEREAKEKLGFKKSNEMVVIVQPQGEEEIVDEIVSRPAQENEDGSLPNYEKWLRYFFPGMYNGNK